MDELTTAEAAERLGLTVRAVQLLIKNGVLPAVRRGRDYFVTPEDVEKARDRPKPGKPSSKANDARPTTNAGPEKKKRKKSKARRRLQ